VKEDETSQAVLSSLGIDPKSHGFTTFKGEGCERCYHTGYSGRIGLFEVFRIDNEIKQLIHKEAGEPELLRAARISGMSTLLEDGIEKIRSGQTTCEEVLRVLGPQNTTAVECPGCGNMLMERHNFCPYCGYRVTIRCEACGSHIEAGWVVCSQCGTRTDSREV
jgi:ribosomal protein L32